MSSSSLVLCFLCFLCVTCFAGFVLPTRALKLKQTQTQEGEEHSHWGRGSSSSSSSSSLPVVLWHGMGDTCCDEHSMGKVAKLIQQELGVHVYSVELGPSTQKDR